MAGQKSRQQGVALVVGLIMLIMLTLIVVSGIIGSSINLRIAGNMQTQDEARAAGQRAIEQFISVYSNFYPTPTGKAATGYDINNDGSSDYQVTIATPVCKRASQQIPPRSLACSSGVKFGVYCWDSMWEVTATAQDTKSGTTQVVTQGVAITFSPAFVPSSAGC